VKFSGDNLLVSVLDQIMFMNKARIIGGNNCKCGFPTLLSS